MLLGAPAVTSFVEAIPPVVMSGLTLAGGMIPAVGFALLLQPMMNGRNFIYFLLGFVLFAYLKLPIMAITIIASASRSSWRMKTVPRALRLPLLTREMTCSMSSEKTALSTDDKKLVKELFVNSFFLENCYNYERQQGLGFALAMWPAIKRFWHTKEERAAALTRHMAIFNTTPHVVGAISGVSAALEREASENLSSTPRSSTT